MQPYLSSGIGLITVALLAITDAWALNASPVNLTFTGLQGGPNPSSQTLTISKNNKRQSNWASSDNAAWLSVTPASGVLTQTGQVAVSVNTSGLGPGSYTATVTIRADRGGSVAVPVTLTVTASATTTPSPSTSSGATAATLTWSPNFETDLAGYKVYVGNAPGSYGSPIVLGKETSYVIGNLQLGHTYYFAVSAYDTSGNESGLSTVASKSIY